ncbi:MAG: BolA/IbaG family iron-sulfur metabolism protein [Myxococcota bacterium]|jgi:acid stress-induced BolA-like protein IbaG/YrbA|nr:BolA/IbaG family iron-sulfur metabolism protein [Myxococcota bacterium]
MPIQIAGPGGALEVQAALDEAVRQALPKAEVEVSAAGPGHFELRVTSAAFAGKTRVGQQQLVYGAIAHLMAGPNAPVHAIDRLECLIPESPNDP